MALVDHTSDLDRYLLPTRVAPADLPLRNIQRILYRCTNIDLMRYPSDPDATKRKIETIVEAAGFSVLDVHLVDHGADLAMGITISHESGIVALTDCQDRPNSFDVVISYRGENAYTAKRCCELMQNYFQADAVLAV